MQKTEILTPTGETHVAAFESKSDTSHLNTIRTRLSHERSRLETSKSDSERELRAAWVAGIERELASELEFLGLPPEPHFSDIDDEDLLAELTRESSPGN